MDSGLHVSVCRSLMYKTVFLTREDWKLSWGAGGRLEDQRLCPFPTHPGFGRTPPNLALLDLGHFTNLPLK